jgi:Ser/Thr protein kinase RdoA (MazF antagonist)
LEVERSIQHIILDHQQLLTLVRKAFPHCQQLDGWKILSGGALNTTYQFQIRPDTFVLRIYTRDRNHCKTEKIIHQLIDNTVTTPKLIYDDNSYEPWAYSIFEFVSGIHISEVTSELKKPFSYELGSVLASIHGFKFEKAGLFGDGITIAHPFPAGSSPYFEEAFRVLSTGQFVRTRLGDKLSNEMLDFMLQNKDFFPRVDENICLTHADFKPVNLLYKADNVFVLDWEFAHAGIGILDFAILLRHRDQFPFDSKSLVKGYSDFGGKLPEEWFRSALITDFINIIQLLDSAPERPQLFHQLKNSIQKTICEWDNSF